MITLNHLGGLLVLWSVIGLNENLDVDSLDIRYGNDGLSIEVDLDDFSLMLLIDYIL